MHRPFQILTAAVFFAVILPVLIQDGMFMDGMLYTSVAHNLANGIGTFWEPIFSTTWQKNGVNTFHEHPPLVFGIQAIFFKLFGSSMYVERLYTLLMAVLTSFFIHKIWRLILGYNSAMQKMSWLPILLWISIPVCFWSYQNNMQENTMGLFSIIAVYFGIQFCKSNATKWISLLFCGIFIFLSTFSKGVPGLFPLAVMGIYWITHFNFSIAKMIISSIILLLIPISLFALFYFTNESAADGLSFYFNMRLMGRVEAAHTVDSRFYIVGRLLSELLGMLIFCGIIMIFRKFNNKKSNLTIDWKTAMCFVLIGISGALPMMLTMVQKGFYLVPAFPYFAIGFSIIIAPTLLSYISKIDTTKNNFKIFKAVAFILLIGTFVFTTTQIGKIKKDNILLEDVYKIGETIPSHSTIRIDKEMWTNWSLQTNLIRHFFISVDKSNIEHEYFLKQKSDATTELSNYEPIAINLNQYTLFKKVVK